MVSLVELLGFPKEVGLTLFAFALALTLAPYLAGQDFGAVKVPALSASQVRFARFAGPLLLLLIGLAHWQRFAKLSPPSNAVAFLPYATHKDAKDLSEIADAFSAEITYQLAQDARISLASSRAARLMSERDSPAKIAEELNVMHVVEGNMLASSQERITLSTHLVDTASRRTIAAWETCFDSIPSRKRIADASKSIANRISDVVVARASKAVGNGAPAKEEPQECVKIEPSPGRVSLLLQFKIGTSELSPSAHEVLRTVGKTLTDPRLKNHKLLIEAHVRATADARKDQSLSDRRALAVKAALASTGIPPSRLATLGRGSSDTSMPAPADERITISLLSD